MKEMPKPNAMLRRLEAQYEAKSARKVNTALQMAKDAADIAASEMFSLGEGRAEKWTKTFSRVLQEMMQMVYDDGSNDPEIVYAKTKIDARLKEIYGKHFQPWSVRYGEKTHE